MAHIDLKNWKEEFTRRFVKRPSSDMVVVVADVKPMTDFISSLLQAQAVQILGEVEEVIGENEKLEPCKLNDPDFEAIGYDNHHATLRNELRAEQRNSLATLKQRYVKEEKL